MEERRYQELAEAALHGLETMLEQVDADDVDVERSGDVLTLTFKDGKKAIVNTQRPTRQIWFAADARAWHFGWDETSASWIDDKGQGFELYAKVADIVRAHTGLSVTPG
jgi:CyaY protein